MSRGMQDSFSEREFGVTQLAHRVSTSGLAPLFAVAHPSRRNDTV